MTSCITNTISPVTGDEKQSTFLIVLKEILHFTDETLQKWQMPRVDLSYSTSVREKQFPLGALVPGRVLQALMCSCQMLPAACLFAIPPKHKGQ